MTFVTFLKIYIIHRIICQNFHVKFCGSKTLKTRPRDQKESILIKRRSSQSILTFSGVPSLLPKQNRSSLLRMESGREIRLRNELLSSSRNRSRLTTGKIPENWNTDFGIRNAFLVNSKQILNCNVS